MTPRHVRLLLAAVTLAGSGALEACGGDASNADTGGTTAITTAITAAGSEVSSSAVIDPGDGGHYAPVIDAASFVDTVDNRYLPLTPGTRWIYEGRSDGHEERAEIVVTEDRKEVMGIVATVVRDTVYADGQLVEDTYDWFAQDADGNVWYLGEDVKNYEDGVLVDTDGSWEAGVGDALPGIVMPAAPTVGSAYRQEYSAGEAEDMGEVIATGGSASGPAGHFEDVITTRDWNPLEPDVIEEKRYAPGVGLIQETMVTGGDDVSELTTFTPIG